MRVRLVRTRLAAALALATATVLSTAVAAGASGLADEVISARVTTPHPAVDEQLTIEGDVTGASSYPVTVSATRTDSTGTTTMPVATESSDMQGHFTLTDTPPARGEVTYHLTADPGGATTDVVTQVAGKATHLSIRVTPHLATVGGDVAVTAHLGSPTTNRSVTISARPYRGSAQQFDQGPVDANGDRQTRHRVARRTTFIVTFDGDTVYSAARVTRTVRARAVVHEHLQGGHGTAHGYRLYHADHDPALAVHMLPERKGTCVHFRAQSKRHGHWVKSAVSPCEKTDGSGRVIGVLTPVSGSQHPVGVPYRLRAEWHGSKAVARRNGRWLRLEFRR